MLNSLDDKRARLVAGLIEKTRRADLQWRELPSGVGYAAGFGQFTVSIGEDGDSSSVTLVVMDGDRRTADAFNDLDMDQGPDLAAAPEGFPSWRTALSRLLRLAASQPADRASRNLDDVLEALEA